MPLYLLGGAMADSELMSLLAWLLQDEYRCVMVDYPSLADLSASRRLSVADLSQALRDVADQHDDERIHIYGSSLGAAVALQAAHGTPERIGRMILHAASAHLELSIGERMAIAMGRWFTRPIGCWPGAAAVFRWNHARWFPPFDATRWGFLEMKLTATPTSLIARRVQTHASFDLREKLALVTPRTVLLTTEGDGATLQRYQKPLAEGLPHCDVHEMDATGHFPHLTHPHRLAKLVRQVIPLQSAEEAFTTEQTVEQSYALENS